MEKLKGSLLFGQSGGHTSVINASAYGVFSEAFNHDCITRVLGAHYGIKGILDDDLFDINSESREELELLKTMPSSALGSVRYKLKPFEEDETDYKRVLEIFRKYNVRYFLYNGGNDSMDTVCKIGAYLKAHGYKCNVVGVPKTIDNDLALTDHCPGFGSAAKYIAASCMELSLDSSVYFNGAITVVEIMGRNAGWLTAASAIAAFNGHGPDLIYVPEIPFDISAFMDDVSAVYNRKGDCFVAVSEGIKDKDGKYISEYASGLATEQDSFNHKQLGGVGAFLASYVKVHTKAKVRAIEFSLLQRCASHIASKTDVEEACLAGTEAVRAAVDGESEVMICFKRAADKNGNYLCETSRVPLCEVANEEKTLPMEFISPTNNFISEKYLGYVLPLIQGESAPPFENGTPRYAKLKRIKPEPKLCK